MHLLGMIEILEHTELEDAQRKLVGVVRESATSLLRIINDILDLSKLEADKLELEDTSVALADIVAGVEATHAAAARANGRARPGVPAGPPRAPTTSATISGAAEGTTGSIRWKAL